MFSIFKVKGKLSFEVIPLLIHKIRIKPKTTDNKRRKTLCGGIFVFFLFCTYLGILRHFKDDIFIKGFVLKGKTVGQCIDEEIDEGRSYFGTDIDILECFFRRTSTFTGDGGIIYINNQADYVSIVKTMFFSCSSGNQGGALYLVVYTRIYLSKICANSCYTLLYGHFGILFSHLENEIFFLSVSNCSYSKSGFFPVSFYDGFQKLFESNFSNNYAYSTSGIVIGNPQSLESGGCSFYNNSSLNDVCICFSRKSGTLSNSNIVKNNSPNTKGVIFVEENGDYIINNCIFKANDNSLMFVEKGFLTLSNCFISHHESITGNTAITITNCSETATSTYFQQFFQSFFCIVENPYVDPTPFRTENVSPDMTLKETADITFENTLEMTHKCTYDLTPLETIDETLFFTPISTHDQTLDSTPFSTIKFTEKETLSLTPVETLSNTMIETPEETLSLTPVETLSNTMIETPEETLSLTPVETLSNTMIETPEETLSLTPVETLSNTMIETPEETLSLTPVETLSNTMIETPEETLSLTPVETLSNTLIETPEETLSLTPVETLSNTMIETPEETLSLTPVETLSNTLIETPEETLSLTPVETLSNTMIETPEETLSITLIETIVFTFEKTNQQTNGYTHQPTMVSSSDDESLTVGQIMSYVGLSIGFIVFIIIAYMFLSKDSNEMSSNTIDSLEENVLWIPSV